MRLLEAEKEALLHVLVFGDGVAMGSGDGWALYSHWLLRSHLFPRLERRIFEWFGGGVCLRCDVLCGTSRGCGLCGEVDGC